MAHFMQGNITDEVMYPPDEYSRLGGNITDILMYPPGYYSILINSRMVPSNGFTLNAIVFYDDNFNNQFGNNSVAR